MKTVTLKSGIQVVPFTPSEEYQKKWNIHLDGMIGGFLQIYVDGVKVSDTLYRKGGFFHEAGGRLQLLKYVEEHYEDSITTDPARKPHLASYSCIIDSDGTELYVQKKQFGSMYLKGGGNVVIDDSTYYNVNTGEPYSNARIHKTVESANYLFLEDAYNNDKSLRGVIQIDKSTGESTLLK